MNMRDIRISPLISARDLFDLFYDEARRIADSDEEALRLSHEALGEFLGHYRTVTARETRLAGSAA